MGAQVRTIAISLFALTCASTSPARADARADHLKDLSDLNKQALSDYAAKDFDAAKISLLEAVGEGGKAGLGETPAMATTYLNLAGVYVNGFQDRARGQRYIAMALKIRPDIELGGALATPSMKEAFVSAKGGGKLAEKGKDPASSAVVPASLTVAGEKRARPADDVLLAKAAKSKKKSGPEEPDLPANIPTPIYCPGLDDVPPDVAVPVHCVARADARVSRIILFYRLPGGETFTALPLLKSPKGWFNNTIPANAVNGKLLQYYLEGRDASDQPTANNGRSDSPNLLLIKSTAPGALAGGTAAPDEPAAGRRGSEDNPLASLEAEQQREKTAIVLHQRPAKSIWVGVGIGTGYGWHPRRDLEHSGSTVLAGSNPASAVQLTPEVGYQLADNLGVALQLRYQIIPTSGSGDLKAGSPATSALAVLAHGYYQMGTGNLQFLATGSLGGGYMRLVIPPKPNQQLFSNDTVKAGVVIVGPGVGLLYHFTPHIALSAEIRLLAGLPDFAVLAEGAVGIQVGF